MTSIAVEWFDGPHDGLRQGIFKDDLPRERTCSCHGATYIAEREQWGWALNYVCPGHKVVALISSGYSLNRPPRNHGS